MQTENKVLMFCANDQAETEHVLDIDGNGEIVLTCACGRFIKMPKETTSESLKEGLEKHREANNGQITVESMDVQKAELIAGLDQSSEVKAKEEMEGKAEEKV